MPPSFNCFVTVASRVSNTCLAPAVKSLLFETKVLSPALSAAAPLESSAVPADNLSIPATSSLDFESRVVSPPYSSDEPLISFVIPLVSSFNCACKSSAELSFEVSNSLKRLFVARVRVVVSAKFLTSAVTSM